LLALIEVTPPGATWPSLTSLDHALFGGRAKPVSAIERLLVAEDGPMNGGGSMRPAFSTESTEWEPLTQGLSEPELHHLLAEREGERLALLDWVRSGASRTAYEDDRHPLSGPLANQPLTAAYLVSPGDASSFVQATSRQVHIRSLINDRCAACHNENGRHERARSFPLDNYDDLAYHCRPESPRQPASRWLLTALAAQLPLAFCSAVCASASSRSTGTAVALMFLTIAAAVASAVTWWVGRPDTIAAWVVVFSSGIFTLGLLVQLAPSIQNLLRKTT
jgi:hypothetical protein